MMWYKYINWLKRACLAGTLIFFSSFGVKGQGRLSLSDCIARALESNYSIKIIRNETSMAKNNVNYSPFLPSVTATAEQSQQRNNVKTENASGVESKVSGANVNNYSVGVGLNWRLFDGLEMFTTHEKYKELQALGELTLQQAIESLIVEVSSSYYNVFPYHWKMLSDMFCPQNDCKSTVHTYMYNLVYVFNLADRCLWRFEVRLILYNCFNQNR